MVSRRVPQGRFATRGEGSDRNSIVDGLREGREKVLTTTNVISRGIDVLQVNMVVNYDLPLMNDREGTSRDGDPRPNIETYIHRHRICTWLFLR